MDGIIKNGGVFFKDMLGTVTVMNIKIDDADLFYPPLFLQIAGTNGHIVKITKSQGPVGFGMMAGGADRAKRIVQLAFHHPIGRFQDAADG